MDALDAAVFFVPEHFRHFRSTAQMFNQLGIVHAHIKRYVSLKRNTPK